MNEDNMPSVADMQAAFGLTSAEPEEPETESTEPTETPTPDDTSSESTSETPSDTQENTEQPAKPTESKPAPQQVPSNISKQNQAFARMRAENAQMQKTMAAMAQVLGVDPKQPIDQLTSQLQLQANNAIAKSRNMDPAILQRLDHLEAINAEYTRIKLESELTEKLKTIETKYGATEGDLEAFVQTLIDDNYNPTEKGADIELEFLRRNFEKINKRMVDEAVKNEQSRSAKGSGASKPTAKQGQEDKTEPHDINTVEALNDFFNNLK